MSSVRAIRGATQAAANTAVAIGDATKELLAEMLRANQITSEEVISVIFTVSPDLNAAFPAGSARELGLLVDNTPCRYIKKPQKINQSLNISYKS